METKSKRLYKNCNKTKPGESIKLRKAKMKREETYKAAIKEHGELIFRICRRFFKSDEDARDVFQDILLKAWLSIEKFRGEASIKTWLTRIAVNTCITYVEKEKRRKDVFMPAYNVRTREIKSKPEREKEEEKINFVREFIEGLDIRDQLAVNLYLEEFSTKEIADATNFSESNIRVKIHRIKEQIKTEWRKKYGTG